MIWWNLGEFAAVGTEIMGNGCDRFAFSLLQTNDAGAAGQGRGPVGDMNQNFVSVCLGQGF